MIALEWFTFKKKTWLVFWLSSVVKTPLEFPILNLEFFFYLITYILVNCVAQGSCEWWEKEEKCFCSSRSHWKSREGLLFNYSRKSWRSSAEEIKNWPSPVFWSWSFSQSSQSSCVRSIKTHWSTSGEPHLLWEWWVTTVCVSGCFMRGAVPWLSNTRSHPPGPSCRDVAALDCGGEKVPGQGHPYTAVWLQSVSPG